MNHTLIQAVKHSNPNIKISNDIIIYFTLNKKTNRLTKKNQENKHLETKVKDLGSEI